MSVSSPAISVRGLRCDYHGTQALSGLTFSVSAGERVGLVGPNGAGKSTLLLHLNGLLQGQGEVHILGRLLERDSLAWVRSRVGLVFADAEDQLFMPTLIEDVAFGPLNQGLPEEQALERAERALGRMGLSAMAERSPHHLSDGERRRAAIATVLSMDPEVWVLDEPAANLDPRARRDLIAILSSLPGTVLVASHDLDLVVQVCQRCLLLDGGELVRDGETRALLADAALMDEHGLEVPLRLQLDACLEGGEGSKT
jgi:cobalt/nickel transport system ATP-binding protein